MLTRDSGIPDLVGGSQRSVVAPLVSFCLCNLQPLVAVTTHTDAPIHALDCCMHVGTKMQHGVRRVLACGATGVRAYRHLTPVILSNTSSTTLRAFATARRGGRAAPDAVSPDARAAEAEFRELSAGADIGSGAEESEDEDGDAEVATLKRAARDNVDEDPAATKREIAASVSKSTREYRAEVDRLSAADTTSRPSTKGNSLSANPYGWDIDTREVKEAPLWMLYEATREEEKLVDRGAGRKLPRVDNETEIRIPMRDEKGRAYATGRRKTAVARVWVKLGDGKFMVNSKPLCDYFPRIHDRKLALEPLVITESCGAFDVYLTTRSGGLSGQAGAIRHGLANALARFDPYLKPVLRRCKFTLIVCLSVCEAALLL